jgi:hypothetical protein
MANQPWLDEVRGQLAKHTLPPAYIGRFMEELSDHFHDITEETMSTEANVASRLGEPNQVAEAAVTAYRRRSFLGRHPTAAFFVFVVSPIVSLVALVGLAFTVLSVSLVACEWIGFDIQHFLMGLTRFEPAASLTLPYVLSLVTVVIPCILASVLYCKLAKRVGIGRNWILVACVMLAATALMPICSVKLSDMPGESALRLGTWNPQSVLGLPHFLVVSLCKPRQLLQFVVPLAIGLWFMRRKRETSPLQLAS